MVNLVSGGAGFIGSNLIEELLKRGEIVICLDNFLNGSYQNISKFSGNPNFRLISKSIIDEIDEDININIIWHFACPASPKFYYQNPIETSNIIFQGTLNLLNYALRKKALFFLASSSEIYGEIENLPIKESHYGNVKTTSKRSCYSEAKRLSETICYDFHRKYGLDVRIARIFNTYGPNMSSDDGRVVSNFIIAALENKPMVINGDGKQTRSFCYVDDLIDGICKLYFLKSPLDNPLNLGNPSEITINEIAEKISTIFEKNINITLRNLPQDDPIQRKPDITLAKKILGWEPKIDLLKGLTKTIEYFKLIK